MTTTARRAGRLLRRTLVAVTAVAVLAATGTTGWLLTLQHGTPEATARTQGRDAVWIGHAWVDGRRGEADAVALAGRLRAGGFSDVYVHAGPLRDDGTLDPALAPRLPWVAGRLRALVPGLRVQAWLGDVVGPDRMRLDDPATRERVVASARQVLGAGADGVHYDLEPLPDGDPGYLALLDATRRETRARGAVLSVAAEPVEPLAGTAAATTWVRPVWWTPGYLREVARRVDQVAMMTYDTALPSRRLYTGLVVRQLEVAAEVVPDDVTLLAGLPAYHGSTVQHRPGAETVPAAVRAARLAAPRPGTQAFGVALYADFSATEDDWRALGGWVSPPSDDALPPGPDRRPAGSDAVS